MIKKLIITVVVIAGVLFGAQFGAKSWLRSMLPDKAHFQALKEAQTEDLAYVNDKVPAHRGNILAVLTNVDSMGEDKETGYEHTELARAYWVFVANGFHVDFASPQGGKPPRVLDGEDMGVFDFAFLNDKTIQSRLDNSIPLADIDPDDYEAVYYVGGKGTMFDFPDNPDIQRITKALYQNDKVVSAVCHGPAALVNVQLDNGEMLLANKQVSGFTNEEELFLIPDAEEVFPFLLEDKLKASGANFQAGKKYLEQVSQDGKIITGQNPWSVWKMAELVVAELGYEPKPRERTPEEYSVELLSLYSAEGFDSALTELQKQPEAYHRLLIVMHGIMAFMNFEISRGFELLDLAGELRDQLKS